jgi:hypothetical protein
MASEQPTDSFQSFLHFLSSSWGWLTSIGLSFAWLIRLNVRVDNLEKATNNLSDIPVRLAKLETKVDMMYQTILDIQKDIKKG